jgi:hypothetical protein
LTVAASDRPEVEIWDGGTARYLNAEPSSTPGKTEYLVPRGAQLRQIALTGRCQQGLCAGVCTPPSGAFVRVDSLAPSESWRTEVATKPTTTVLDPGAPLPIFRVVFDASRPAALHVDVDAAIAPQILGPMSGEFIVSWPAANGLSRPITVTWTARVVIEGACPGPEPCASPENEHVEIKSVSLARDLQ